MGRVNLLFKLKLNEFHFGKQYCQVIIIDTGKYFQEKYNIKSPSLSGSRIVGKAFLKSFSIAEGKNAGPKDHVFPVCSSFI